MATILDNNPDSLPQPIGESRPIDEWQAHVNHIFYGMWGSRLRDLYQTFASGDFRLAHALATDYYEHVLGREKRRKSSSPVPASPVAPQLSVVEIGVGNGNLAACFLSQLKRLDKQGLVYPRLRYMMVDNQAATLDTAKGHPDLAEHLSRVETLLGAADSLPAIPDSSVDFVLCNELWSELPTKLMLRNGGEVEEEFVRPNLNEKRHAQIGNWSGFVQAFDKKDLDVLRSFPPFLEDIVWEREYQKTEWKSVPYRKTITDFLKQIDEKILTPVNLGAFSMLKEAKRLLAADAIGVSAFDAGTADLDVLNDPEKPCYGQLGGQFSFMVNFPLMKSVAMHLGYEEIGIETQREFIGRSLATNVLSLTDLLATHPSAASMKPWEQDRLVLKTVEALNESYTSPYQRTFDFPIREGAPPEEAEQLRRLQASFRHDGVADTVAYLSEDDLMRTMRGLEGLGYERGRIEAVLTARPNVIEYFHFFCRSHNPSEI